MPAMLLSLHAFSCFRYEKAPAAVRCDRQGGYLPGMGRFKPTTGGFQVSSKAPPKFGRAGR